MEEMALPRPAQQAKAPAPTSSDPKRCSARLARLSAGSSNPQAAQDPVTPLVAEARSGLERVVGQLARRRSTDQRRLRAASKKKTRER